MKSSSVLKNEVLMGYCTFPDAAVAETICQQLVAESLVACANILPAHQAIYAWQGKLEKTQECGVIFKTTSHKKKSLMSRFVSLHPYSVPALVFWKIEDGHPEFLKWVAGQCL